MPNKVGLALTSILILQVVGLAIGGWLLWRQQNADASIQDLQQRIADLESTPDGFLPGEATGIVKMWLASREINPSSNQAPYGTCLGLHLGWWSSESGFTESQVEAGIWIVTISTGSWRVFEQSKTVEQIGRSRTTFMNAGC